MNRDDLAFIEVKTMPTKEDQIAAHRARYEELKARGRAPTALPGPSQRPAPMPTAELHRETIPGGWYWATRLKPGESLRLQTSAIPSCVSLIAWRSKDISERLNYADTVKIQWTSALCKGRVIFSDMGRVMLSIIEDSCGYHDALVGGSSQRSNAKRYMGGPFRNTRDNFVLAAQKLGMGPRDIPPCISFFAPVRVDEDGHFCWHADRRTSGDYVDLRAEMDLLVAISNCPHPLDPDPDYAPGPIDAVRFLGLEPQDDDLCRTATDEARRGFENNAALVL